MLLDCGLLLCIEVMGLNQEAQLLSQMTSATVYNSDPALCCWEDGKAACDVHITPYLLCHCQNGI